jgi:hypothetical protein
MTDVELDTQGRLRIELPSNGLDNSLHILGPIRLFDAETDREVSSRTLALDLQCRPFAPLIGILTMLVDDEGVILPKEARPIVDTETKQAKQRQFRYEIVQIYLRPKDPEPAPDKN